jgi:hypothetical protein
MTELHTPQEDAPQETGAVIPSKPSLKERIGGALAHPKAPLVAGAVVLVIAGAVALYVKAPAGSVNPFSRPNIVTFDPVRFVNAERVVASLIAAKPNSDGALSLAQAAKQAEPVIREEAHGAVVIVKQALVAPEGVPDITDAVLTRFGLPTTNVPTITTSVSSSESLESIAPTDNAFSQGKLREDYRLELEGKRDKILQQQSKDQSQADVLP